ncbi:MAG TPA: hypothetical protein VMU54_19990 [Planctomycetota bacterium]|nr:hypothetical protein [Planctomycetota bacterium]
MAHLDPQLKPVKCEMLERTLDEQALRQIRELSWSLRDKLHLVTTQLNFPIRRTGRWRSAGERGTR